ncbi:HET-domain-containing protein [Byssothecium circinans]|uniref:HET-domain-containing protein n=1 Tax=Byssothecium circinans TaxID=147558 RepID=A0A6A5UBG1_9PLEO|nr:HET-domain-containing protein [Byssothecium circinans]
MWEGVQFVQFYVPPGGKTPWPRFGQGIDLREVLNLDDSVERIREWLHHCGEQHQACHKSSTSELPNRLVEVGDVGADRVHLRTITSASKSPYTALSYCWGDPEGNMKTTKGNVGLYEDEGIQLSLIPHTIRDAINITRELAIPYIWVDALCIIQDDNDDWEKEAQKMRHVYADAYLVISATRSASANQGIFGLRKAVSSDLGYCIKQVPDSFTVERLQLDVDGNSAFSPIHVREELNHALAFREPSDCNAHPLLNRAWAFQERVLATRVVHFGASEIIWNCQESTRCECQTATLEDSGHPFHPTSIRSSEKSGFWWQLLITEYTSLSLTYVKDKLAALEGISQRCEGPRLGKYCFGLWENYILYHMLWRSITSRLSPIPDEQKDVFLGPSWSWVSTHHPVSFDWHHMCFNPTLKAELKGGLPTHDPVDIVLDPRRPLAPLFPFQPSWRLTLKARVRDAVFEIESCSPPDCRYRLHLQPLSVDAEIDQADFFPDFVLCPNHASHDSLMARSKWLEDKDTVQCVLLQDGEEFYADVEQSGYAWKALVVKPIDNDSGVFRRVGIATSNLESRPDEKRPMSSRTISPWNTDEREITLV